MSSTAKNIIELRHLLAEKFPGVRMQAGRPEVLSARWPTGLPQLDLQLGGGLPKGGITEVICPGVRSGGGLLLARMIEQARAGGEWIALIDSMDSFDPSALENDALERLLWVRCAHARQAVKAIDLILRDGTFGVAALDFVNCPRVQLRRIVSSAWHRMSRLLEGGSTACLVLSAEPMISTAMMRLQLLPRFDLKALDAPRVQLLAQVMVQPAADRNETRFGRSAGTAS
jgi:hypothetical protein